MEELRPSIKELPFPHTDGEYDTVVVSLAYHISDIDFLFKPLTDWLRFFPKQQSIAFYII